MSKTVDMGPLGQVELRLPKSTLVRYEVLRCGAEEHTRTTRAMCSALGLCWTGKRTLPDYTRSFNPMTHGGEVFDALVAAGVEPAKVFTAAAEAFDLLASSVISEKEVAALEGNSDAPAEPSTSLS